MECERGITMKEYNYRAMAINKVFTTKRRIEKMIEKSPDDKTLEIFGTQTIARMEFMYKTLESWFSDGIEDRWDAETISNGKAACIGNIDSLELLTKDMEDALFKKA